MKSRVFACDFETTVFKGQETTEVWASACAELFTDDEPKIFHSIDEQFNYFISLDSNLILYYHNLKFDGEFWMYYLMVNLGYELAIYYKNEEKTDGEFIDNRYMKNNTFKYVISDLGQWYSLTIKVGGHYIELRDSLKLLPFSLKRIGESFGTKHKKLEMEYEGIRYAGCTITEAERQYIANDVLVLKEALEIMYEQGHTKLTIGSCCISEYKKSVGDYDYKAMFPDLTAIEIDSNTYGASNVDEYIRKSYRGGWCYVVKGKENQLKKNGITADVNSLYPSMMSSESGNCYPIGKPKFWSGNFIPEIATHPNYYYFVRIKTRFKIKPNMLPFIQIKGNMFYRGTEMLETSDIYDKTTKKYYSKYRLDGGEIKDASVTLTLTQTDFALMQEHYDLFDLQILDGCYFLTDKTLFDDYINHYKQIKLNNKGALRELAKLFLNNLYGKLASSTKSSFKISFVKDNGCIGYVTVPQFDKKSGYIACGSAITSYARNFTIRAAQKNYYGADKRGFIYADTDSIHCDLKPEELKGITVHDKNFCCWKLESSWDEAIFVRPKTYIEHVTQENLCDIEKPYYNIKCAGMPDRCKQLFLMSMQGTTSDNDDVTEEEKEFLSKKRTLFDFKIGLKIPSKLVPKRIIGGILLVPTTYEMRKI